MAFANGVVSSHYLTLRASPHILYAHCYHKRVIEMIPNAARSTSRPTNTKSERLAVRISPEQRSLLVEASRTQDKTVTEFVLSAATRAAEDVLADRHRFVLAESEWTAFLAALDRPPREFPRLRRLLATHSVLDEA